MGLPNKNLTAAQSILNKFAPFADRMIGCWPLNETSGTDFANDGVRASFGGFELGANTTKIGSGAFDFTGTAVADPVNGPYIQTTAGTASAGACISLYANSSGSTATVAAQGTLLLRFYDPGSTPASERAIFNCGATVATTTGVIQVSRSTSDGLLIRGYGTTITFTNSTHIDWTAWNTLIVQWGASRDLTAILNRNNTSLTAAGGKQSASLVSGSATMTVANGRSLLIGGITTGATAFTINVSQCALWDKRMDMYPQSDKDIAILLSDPWLVSRPAASLTAEFSTAVGPMIARPTSTTATANLVSGFGGSGDISGTLTFTTGLNWRLKYGTSDDPTSANHCNTTSTGSAITDSANIITAINLSLTSLSADTEYSYRAEFTNDNGTTWYPLPGGLGRFMTKRTVAGDWYPNIYSDDHYGNDSDIWAHTTLANIRYGAANYVAANASPKAFAFERAIQYNVLFRRGDFNIITGDFYMPDASRVLDATSTDIDTRNDLLFYDIAVRAAAHRNFAHRLYSDCATFVCLGNHEVENGYSQNCDIYLADSDKKGAYQAVATNVRKTYFPGPTNSTYSEGGENEGDPSVFVADELAVEHSSVLWVPRNTGIFATYGYEDYVTDFVIGSHADPRGLNTSPLENYYAFTWGGGTRQSLFVVMDSYRYTAPGDPIQTGSTLAASGNLGGVRVRPLGTFTYGAAQLTWARSVLLASSAPRKFVVAHQYPGGVRGAEAGNGSAGYSYGRQSGLTETGSEWVTLRELLQQIGITGFVTGHDHRFMLSRKSNVNHVKLPTCSAPSISGTGGGAGWHHSAMTVDSGFGFAETNGADLVAYQDGLNTANGALMAVNAMGVATLDLGDGTATLKMVVTEYGRAQGGSNVLTETLLYNERFLPTAVVPSPSDVVTLPTNPRTVQEAYLTAAVQNDRDVADPWWSTPPTSRKGTAVGSYAYDWDQPDAATVTLDTSVNDSSVRVMSTPCVVYSAALTNASATISDEEGLGRTRARARGRGRHNA